jgi:hypothetical protein
VRKHFPAREHETFLSERGSIVGQGELKKVEWDPLFGINHTCAMLRANVNRLIRKTWCTTKKPDMLKRYLPILVENFKELFPEVKTGNVLEKEILKRVAFFKKIFTF